MTTSIALASVGAGLAAIGAGIGIGQVWASGIQGMSRQPEMASKIQTSMFIGAALVEGMALFALVICFLQM
jgi:F-type H+-transporting ATPase subunit c